MNNKSYKLKRNSGEAKQETGRVNVKAVGIHKLEHQDVGSAHQSSPLENKLHKQRKTNTDEGPIWRPTYLQIWYGFFKDVKGFLNT